MNPNVTKKILAHGCLTVHEPRPRASLVHAACSMQPPILSSAPEVKRFGAAKVSCAAKDVTLGELLAAKRLW